jgi:hypothetical protein
LTFLFWPENGARKASSSRKAPEMGLFRYFFLYSGRKNPYDEGALEAETFRLKNVWISTSILKEQGAARQWLIA